MDEAAHPLRDQVLEVEDVAEGLGHLLPLDLQELAVQPVAHELLPRRPLRLRDLVLVVGEGQVHPARVDVERLPQLLHAHHRALDVPPRAPPAPRRVPHRPHRLVLRLHRLPEGEVAHVLLVVLVAGHALPAAARAQVHLGQLPVLRELGDVVVDRAVRLVGDPALLQAADQLHHPGDVVRGARVHVRPGDPQRVQVVEEQLREGLRVLLQPHPLRVRPADGLVVHVGEVHHELHLVPPVLQVPVEDVREEEGAEVTDVRGGVDGGAAAVHPHPAFHQGDELFQPARERVVELKGHGSSTGRRWRRRARSAPARGSSGSASGGAVPTSPPGCRAHAFSGGCAAAGSCSPSRRYRL